jgi:GNAT superfamily N-acetyltransferase
MADALDDPRAIVHAALVAPSPLERYRSGPARRAIQGAVALICDGELGTDFNCVVVLGAARPDQVFAAAEAFFSDARAYSVLLEVDAAPAMEEAVLAAGWHLDEEEPALALARLPARFPAAPPELEIRRVVDSVGLADFRGVSETPSVFLPSLAASLDPDVGLFVGYLDGMPVATARMACLGAIAEVHGVVTRPDARRRGYGMALTWAAIAAAAARGCVSAMLTASAMGYPLYVRMGFVPVGIYRTYLPPARQTSD